MDRVRRFTPLIVRLHGRSPKGTQLAREVHNIGRRKNVTIIRISRNEKKQVPSFNAPGGQTTEKNLRTVLKYVNSHLTCEKGSEQRQQQQQQENNQSGNAKLPDVENIEAHFMSIGERRAKPYLDSLEALVGSTCPVFPAEFAFRSGWVRYSKDGKTFETVEAPEGNAIVFDVETVVTEGGLPAMAVALSDSAWFSWCSSALVNGGNHRVDHITVDPLIPLGRSEHACLVVGHCVSFDRSFVKEEYEMKQSKRRFLDTLSMHVCVSGQSTAQKMISVIQNKWREKSKSSEEEEEPQQKKPLLKWQEISSLNNLADVHELYCGRKLEKSARDIFVTGSSADIREHFHELMKYCFKDVKATKDVLAKLLPLFLEHSPHPVSLLGIIDTCTPYLPINENWLKYLSKAEAKYQEAHAEIRVHLNRLATEACGMFVDERWRDDPWLWDLDWSMSVAKENSYEISNEMDRVESSFQTSPTGSHERKIPKWYKVLFSQSTGGEHLQTDENNDGCYSVSLRKRCAPKLLRLLWDGYPVHRHDVFGWGCLVPTTENSSSPMVETIRLIKESVDRKTFASVSFEEELEEIGDCSKMDSFADWAKLRAAYGKNLDEKEKSEEIDGMDRKINVENITEGDIDIGIEDVKFRRLPHKFGIKYNLGSPLSNEFVEKYYGNFLTSWKSPIADRILCLIKESAQWHRSRRQRREQMAVWTDGGCGAILPRVLPAGHVSRRPTERTWFNKTNIDKSQTGSEFRTMIQVPSGMHFVGAFFPLLDLWTATLLSVSTLGPEALNTSLSNRISAYSKLDEFKYDLESAKVLEFARIYGLGSSTCGKLLKKFNPNLTSKQATNDIRKLFDQKTEGFIGHYCRKNGEASRTPFLSVKITRALDPEFVGRYYRKCYIAWVIQSSSVDYLHLILSSVDDLFRLWNIEGRLVISNHNEVHYMVRSENRFWAALAVHLSNLYAQLMVTSQLGITDPTSVVTPFDRVHIDKTLRVNVEDDAVTPSNVEGLRQTSNIPFGESLNISETLERATNQTFSGKQHGYQSCTRSQSI